MKKTDYTQTKRAPVLVCFVKYKDKYLLLKRSNKVLVYKELWSSVAGFLDDQKTIKEKVWEELTEELGITKENIIVMQQGPVYTFTDEKLGREWIRNLVLATIDTPNITLDWEHTEYKWITPDEVQKYETVPGFLNDLQKICKI